MKNDSPALNTSPTPLRLSPRPTGWPALKVVVLIMAWCAGTVQGRECLRWIQRSDVGSYGQRWGHAMAYDSDRGVTVLFGGERGTDNAREYFNDTWEYDGIAWREINVTGPKPSPRAFHAMAYDRDGRRMILAGGESVGSVQSACSPYGFADTWEYHSDGVNGSWSLVYSGDSFPARSGHAMVPWRLSGWWTVLAVHGTHVTYPPGPLDVCDTPHIPNYDYYNSGWVHLDHIFTGEPSDRANSWGVAAVSVQMADGETAVYSIGGSEDLQEKFYRNSLLPIPYPGIYARRLAAAAFDEERRRIVIVGGDGGGGPQLGEEAYELDIADEREWVPVTPLPSGQGRSGARMVYDTRRGVMVLTGGAGGGASDWENGGRYDDTWELLTLRPEYYVSPDPAEGTVCEPVTLQLRAEGVSDIREIGFLTFQWRLDGVPISEEDAGYSGTTTSTLQIDPLRQSHAGRYDVQVREPACGLILTSRVSNLKLNPGLQWAFRTTNGPMARNGHAMAYDSHRKVTVLFGGRHIWPGASADEADGLNDLWEWDGWNWRQRLAGTTHVGWEIYSPEVGWRPSYQDRPVQRAFHAMAYDSERDRLVVFGGNPIDPQGRIDLFTPLNDLWEWDGQAWHFMGTNGPPPRSDGAMAYDTARRRIVFFGGTRRAWEPDPLRTWEWDGTNWLQGAELPGGTFSHEIGGMVYDTFRKTTVYGPTAGSDWAFWDWDGKSWTPAISGSPLTGEATQLLGLEDGAMAFDQARRRVIWFGGYGGYGGTILTNHTGLFDGATWTLLEDFGAPAPASRMDAAMAYDPARKVTVLFGGDIQGLSPSSTNDTWELVAIDKPMITVPPAEQTLRVGEMIQFQVAALGGPLTYQWYRIDSHIPLSNNGHLQGTQTATLTIQNAQLSDIGVYYVEVRNPCGVTASRFVGLSLPGLNIRSTPGLDLGTESSNGELAIVWSQANTLLQQATDPAGPWIDLEGATSPYIPGAAARRGFFRLRFGSPP